MEALALAVATAVIQYLVDKADLLENVRGWLKRDPASLAYQRALLRAYAAFARSDPALAKSFFDETFLTGAVVPELAKQLTRHEHASSAELARLWAASLYVDALAEQRAQWATNERIMLACANFLQWLENELKREQVFQPLFDSRALDGLEAKFDELVRVLTTQRDEAMKRAEQYQPVVNQIARPSSVNISDSSNVVVNGDIIGGDKIVRNYFYGNFTSLDDYYISPELVYQRVKIDEFVGREWLVGRIDAFLNDASRASGMFRIEGEAGVGKTAFLAHLVRERGYLHLFAEQVPGDNNVERALLSLGAQLVSRYRLDPYADRNTLPAIAGFSDFVFKLLDLASQRLTAGEKIIVVCDALDEAGNGTNGNVFGLPATLPDNVYFILSQRPVVVRLDVKCEIHNERVKPDNADNLHDIEDYLRGMAGRPQIAQQLRARNYSDAKFVRVLLDKSSGVWMYLQYVLDKIARGSRHPLELDALPNGLVGYYLAYWGDWRAGRNHRGKGKDEWYGLYLPLLTTLAAAQEPIPLDTLSAWAGVNATQYQVRNLLREQWRAFITEREEQGHAARFILYHASLRDFLTGKVDTNALSSADINFIDELRDGTRAAHQRIVANFSERCRGTWTDLIHDEYIHHDYACRYLTLHLEGAEQYDIMRELVAWSDAWAKARYDKEESWSGYLTDLERVWSFAEEKENVGWQIRCALIESTIHSLAGNISPDLLAQIVETKIWSPARALVHLAQMPSDEDKESGLKKLAPLLPVELMREAFIVANSIQEEIQKARALRELAPYLSSQLLAEAWNATRQIQGEYSKALTLRALALHMPSEQRQDSIAESLMVTRKIRETQSIAYGLSEVAEQLSGEQRQELLNEALMAARQVEDYRDRANALCRLAPQFSLPQRNKVLQEALRTARKIKSEYFRSNILRMLALQQPRQKKHLMLQEALSVARKIRNGGSKVEALNQLIPLFPRAQRQSLAQETLHLILGDQFYFMVPHSLTKLIPTLSRTLLRAVLEIAQEIEDEYSKSILLAALVPRLPPAKRQDALQEALTTARRIQYSTGKVWVLTELARQFPSHTQQKVVLDALKAAQEIQDEISKSEALVALVPHLSHELFATALEVVRVIQDDQIKAKAFNGLVKELPHELQGAALIVTSELQPESRVFALGLMASRLAPKDQRKVLEEAVRIAQSLQDKDVRARAMAALSWQLPMPEQHNLLLEALASARSIEPEWRKARVMGDLAQQLSTESIGEAWVVVESIQDEHS